MLSLCRWPMRKSNAGSPARRREMPVTEIRLDLLAHKVQTCQPDPSPAMFLRSRQLAQVGNSLQWPPTRPAAPLLQEGTASVVYFNIQPP